MKAIVFGAGKIARGFIGQLLYLSKADITFVDIDQQLGDRLNKDQKYHVYILGDSSLDSDVTGFQAVQLEDEKRIGAALVEADIAFVSVGGANLKSLGEKIGRIYYWNGEALEAFLGDVESSPLPDIDFEMSLKKQKDNIVAMLINAEANKERLKSMTETLNDMMKESQDIVEDIPETLFILSNETRQFGAICMLYPEVLKKFCVEKMIDNITKNNIISKYCMITESRN